ncbi:helix-turn-helix transcriptional regulator [Sanguibacter sp. A247]|uniref:helix-turn-helix transcriptional regulator n=1 Tax=unclassified Sanguibacter TaxID=2645534 RepID=UPI003FD851FF
MSSATTALGRALAAGSRVELLHLLQTSGPLHLEDLVATTGLHSNTVRGHLAVLCEVDLVRREPEVRTVRGRPRMVYRATSAQDVADDPEASRRLDDSIEQARRAAAVVAHAWNDAAVPDEAAGSATPGRDVLALEAHLDRVGFDPVYEASEATFHLWRCPFVELARALPEVVCRLHEGLAQRTLDAAGGEHDVVRLQPFVGPDHCTLSLQPRPAAAPGGAETAPAEPRAASTCSPAGPADAQVAGAYEQTERSCGATVD